jgi:GxxExxY protein
MQQEGAKARRFLDFSWRTIGACIEVHRQLGPGLLESAYRNCLAREFELRRLRFDRERSVPVSYKGIAIDCGYRLDFVVEDSLILEVKAVAQLQPVHAAQVITYLKLTAFPVGLLVNFHSEVLRDGIRRFVHGR